MSEKSDSQSPTIFINPRSGSIRYTGTVDFVDAAGNLIETHTDFKMCGCGHSKNKPFCDDSHKEFLTPQIP